MGKPPVQYRIQSPSLPDGIVPGRVEKKGSRKRAGHYPGCQMSPGPVVRRIDEMFQGRMPWVVCPERGYLGIQHAWPVLGGQEIVPKYNHVEVPRPNVYGEWRAVTGGAKVSGCRKFQAIFNHLNGPVMRKNIAYCVLLVFVVTSAADAKKITGHYLESRTCQVYTGPCFANGETGLAGKNALMAWSIVAGDYQGVDLAGLKVVIAVDAADTLGFLGFDGVGEVKSIVYVDEKATDDQHAALLKFVREHAGRAGRSVVRVTTAPIEMSLNEKRLDARLDVGKAVRVVARKARLDDCICSNESAYYPPLAEVSFFAPGVTTVNEFKGRGLGSRWSTPGARSAYLAIFNY
ncbi:MAG: hypothetical protein CMJ81_21185 [Planctomycetaceae bacterium]|nr:hypothetical protein [Planctomycetaceae bacterium]